MNAKKSHAWNQPNVVSTRLNRTCASVLQNTELLSATVAS